LLRKRKNLRLLRSSRGRGEVYFDLKDWKRAVGIRILKGYRLSYSKGAVQGSRIKNGRGGEENGCKIRGGRRAFHRCGTKKFLEQGLRRARNNRRYRYMDAKKKGSD